MENEIKNQEDGIDMKINMIKTVTDVKKIGDSYYIHVDRNIRKHLHIEKGVVLGMKLWNIETKKVICPFCKAEFDSYDDELNHDCPKCGKEIINTQLNDKQEVKNDRI